MLFSGYQLGIHLLNSTFADVSLDREDTIKNRRPVEIAEMYLRNRITSRNNLFIVAGKFRNELEKVVIKQPRFDGATYISSSLNESYVLTLFKAAGFTKLATLIGYDQFQHLLFQRFVDHVELDQDSEPDAVTLTRIAQELGPLFAQVHSVNTDESWAARGYQNRFGYRKPFLYETTIRDIEELRMSTLPPEQRQVVDLLASNNYALLEHIRAMPWQQTALIHFDFKFAHVLFSNDTSIASIIDWEMADIGDVCWDVASVWFELIRPFMYGDETPNSLIINSLPFLNAFLSTYRLTKPSTINSQKLQQFLGVLLLQKHFYAQLDEGMGIEKSNQWLVQAERLILNSTQHWSLPVPFLSQSPARLSPYAPIPVANHTSGGGEHFDSIKDVTELATILVDDYRNGLPKPDAELPLAQYIYKWFNGNLGYSVDAIDKEQLAAIPKVGKEVMLDDLWWMVEGYANNNRIVIRKNSERRTADPGAFIYQQHDARTSPRLALKSFVKLQFPQFVVRPNDARQDSNDFWILGRQLVRQDWSNWTRFYVNLKRDANGIHLFINLISEKLNERCIPFELKLRNALSSYTRTDVAILFIHRQHVNASLDTIAYVYNQLKRGDYLREGTPKFTKRFSPFDSLSFAENPSEKSVSFGMWRSQLIVNSILPELARPTVTSALIKDKILHGLKEKNFNIYELYRNPYPEKNEYKYRFDLLEKKLKKPALLDSPIDASIRYLPKQRFLKSARTVGFRLCREAVWYGSCCTWFCFKKDDDVKGYFTTASDTDLLGIALFLCQLAILCPQDGIFEDCTRGVMEFARENDQKELDTLLEEIVTKLKTQPIATVQPNVPSSANSISDANLFGEELITFNAKSPFFADSLIERFIEKGIPFPNGYSESLDDPTRTEFNPTLTHGLTALGYFFLALSDNKNHPVVPLTTIYGSQIPNLFPMGKFFS